MKPMSLLDLDLSKFKKLDTAIFAQPEKAKIKAEAKESLTELARKLKEIEK